jgi:hypothetical protein
VKWMFLFLATYLFAVQSPEEQIVIVENFLSPEESNALIQFYNRAKNDLNQHTDNQLTFSAATPQSALKILSTISHRVIALMQQTYALPEQKYHVDHCALYARIPGNYCPYHADNIAFYCPIHGSDQSQLRVHCNGRCSGAKFIPNHTPWREYTALLYLNDAFTGGEILFEDGPCNRLYKKVIPIKAGLLVLTPNGPNFYHEVFPIRSGRRYSLHLWYTSDPRYVHALGQ